MALKDSKSFWRPARENEAKCVFHVMLWFHFLVSTQPFPLNSTQLYELPVRISNRICRGSDAPPREKYRNVFGKGCTCEGGLRLKLFNTSVSRATIRSVWEFLPFSETPVTCSALKWTENTEQRDLSDITFQHHPSWRSSTVLCGWSAPVCEGVRSHLFTCSHSCGSACVAASGPSVGLC